MINLSARDENHLRKLIDKFVGGYTFCKEGNVFQMGTGLISSRLPSGCIMDMLKSNPGAALRSYQNSSVEIMTAVPIHFPSLLCGMTPAESVDRFTLNPDSHPAYAKQAKALDADPNAPVKFTNFYMDGWLPVFNMSSTAELSKCAADYEENPITSYVPESLMPVRNCMGRRPLRYVMQTAVCADKYMREPSEDSEWIKRFYRDSIPSMIKAGGANTYLKQQVLLDFARMWATELQQLTILKELGVLDTDLSRQAGYVAEILELVASLWDAVEIAGAKF